MMTPEEVKTLDSEGGADDYDEDGAARDDKFLTFCLGQEIYGIPIVFVLEIIRIIKITPMPEMFDFIKGVINLRGKVIPVMDVRLRFGLKEKNYDDRTCVIVVQIRELEIGLIVDTVSEVLEIPPLQIEPPPRMHAKSQQRYIMGIGKTGDSVKILLDLNKLLFEEEIMKLSQAGGE